MSRWHLAHLSVRKRLLFNNFIMVLVPVLLLVISSTAIFMGLRATGNFRDREIELVWPEAGDSAAIQLGLSHLRAHVDWKWKDNSVGAIHRHVATLERAGILVAVVDDGAEVYETVPGTADSLLADSSACSKAHPKSVSHEAASVIVRLANVAFFIRLCGV